MTTEQSVLANADRYFSPSMRLSFPPVVVDGAQGSWFWNKEGKRFLDLHSMACIMNVGYGHPRVTDAIMRQATQLVHGNPAYVVVEPAVELAQRLADLAPGNSDKRVCFGLSGSDANDAAMKLSRAATGRPLIVSFFGAYHGNTYGALSLSAVSQAMRRGFQPVVPGVVHAPYPDLFRGDHPHDDGADIAGFYLKSLEQLFETIAPPDQVAALIIEPIQGDSGILVPPADYLPRLRELADAHGFLLVAEEVQTGVGRTGQFYAVEHTGVVPDIMVIGKALGGGMPVSAIVARSEIMDAWAAPGHVLSTSANAVGCATALAVLDIMADEDLVQHSRARGAQLHAGLERLARQYEEIGDIRGRGLMLGVDLIGDPVTRTKNRALAAKVIHGCFTRGAFITFLAGSVLRFAPPLVITAEEIDLALGILEEALEDGVSGRIRDEEIAHLAGW